MRLSSLVAFSLLFAIVATVLLVWFYPSDTDFSAKNPFWDGLSKFNERFHAKSLSSLNDLPSEPDRTVLVEIPYRQFSIEEGRQLQDYVHRGGTLLLLDDYGYGNQVLSMLGQSMRFSGSPLVDPLFNYNSSALPVIFQLAGVASNCESILLNHATVLYESTEKALAVSSPLSYLDENDNGALDQGESTGPFTVAAYTQVGNGLLIAVADPSILINSTLTLNDNLRFVSALVGAAGPETEVLVDHSHLEADTLDKTKGALSWIRESASRPPGVIFLTVAAVLIPFVPLLHRKGLRIHGA